jgi:hypothetical protein
MAKGVRRNPTVACGEKAEKRPVGLVNGLAGGSGWSHRQAGPRLFGFTRSAVSGMPI